MVMLFATIPPTPAFSHFSTGCTHSVMPAQPANTGFLKTSPHIFVSSDKAAPFLVAPLSALAAYSSSNSILFMMSS